MPRATDRVHTVRRRRAALAAAMLTALACTGVFAVPSGADEPLHERIDRLIEADQIAPLAPPANDAEFLRRATLDLVGRIPSVAEVPHLRR